MKRITCLFVSACCLLVSCDTAPSRSPGAIDLPRLLKADEEPGNWMSLGRNFMQQHHSPLSKIDTGNVKDLGLAWEYTTNASRGKVNRGLEATPIVVDGVLYTSGSWSIVFALNAKTGEEIWRYDPQVDGNYARRACCDVVNRGVQVWKGKVYVGTLDGYLVCLDAATGKPVWKADTFTDRKTFYTITSAPQVAKDKIIIGNSGGEYDARGYITAFDLETGKFAWRFFTVPGDPKKPFEHPELEAAAKTWDRESTWENGGGGTVWGQMAYDPELNLLYFGTGNSVPYPQWFRSPAGGDNLFLVSIIAINPDNGRMAWYYQTTPGEIWDYTCTANIVLADLVIENKPVKALMQAPKNGFYYVLDRTNGKLLSAKNYVPVNWASHVDLASGRPVLTEQGQYKTGPKFIFPFLAGGHNWHPMSFSPQTGLAYIPTLDMGFMYAALPAYRYRRGFGNEHILYDYTPEMVKQQEVQQKLFAKKEGNILKAWNPVTQTEAWRVVLGSDGLGGVLSTDGDLVFNGTWSGKLMAYHAQTGQVLKEINTGTGILAAPMTYEVDGEQYVAVMAGFGGGAMPIPEPVWAVTKYRNTGRLLVYKLGGKNTPLPPLRSRDSILTEPPSMLFDKVAVLKGKQLFNAVCGTCHVNFGDQHLSEYPDLSMMSAATHAAFNDILLKGKLSYYGMADFSDILTAADVDALHQYLATVQQDRFDMTGKKKAVQTKRH